MNVIELGGADLEKQPMTEGWRLYELGRQYNQELTPNQYDLVNANIEFYIGNQWFNLPQNSAMNALPKPVFNIIKRVVSLFVASLTSTSTKVSYESLANKDGTNLDDPSANAAQMASAEVANLFDKFKMDFRLRDCLFDGAQTGDYCMHFMWDPNSIPYGGAYGPYRGEITMEMVDGINVMFGNPNTNVVEDQPYILIVGRDTVGALQEEYLRHHKKGMELVQPDTETEWQAGVGGKTELIGADQYDKALYVYLYHKVSKEVTMTDADGNPVLETVTDKNGEPVIDKTPEGVPMYDVMGAPVYKQRPVKQLVSTVHVSKHTRNVTIFDDIDTGLSFYPIAWGNWERQKNQYHGRALVTGIIPNQIYINGMFALVMRHQQMLGFPKIVFNKDYLPYWNNTVGEAIGISNLPDGVPLTNLYAVLQPADMSTQIMGCIDMALNYTKECLGATDAQLGNVKPDNTSALIALQSSAQVPLENPQACKYEFVEDVGRILLDMMGTYYGERPVVRTKETMVPVQVPQINPNNGQPVADPATGAPLRATEMQTQKQQVIEMFDFSQLKNLWFNIRADVGASTYWSRIAIVQTLDNLKRDGLLDIIDYLERMPDEYIPLRTELIEKHKQLRAQTGMMDPTTVATGKQGTNNGMAGAHAVGALPTSMQGQFDQFSKRSQNVLLKQIGQQNL